MAVLPEQVHHWVPEHHSSQQAEVDIRHVQEVRIAQALDRAVAAVECTKDDLAVVDQVVEVVEGNLTYNLEREVEHHKEVE